MDMLTDMQPQPSFDLVSDIQQLLQFHFMQNAFEAGGIVAVFAGVVGYFMVTRGQSFAGHTLSQVGFPGAAGAALVGVSPLVGLLVFCSAAALGIAAFSDPRSQERRAETAAIGAILAFALALGYLFARLYSSTITTIYSFLFGEVLGVNDSQVLILLVVAVASLAILIALGRPLLFASVDADVAAARGVPVRLLSVIFLLVLGLAVAATSAITGTLLVFALLVAPAAAAQQFTTRPLRGIGLSVAIALGVTWGGLSLAYFMVSYPIGFFVTTIAFAVYLIAKASRWLTREAKPRLAVAG